MFDRHRDRAAVQHAVYGMHTHPHAVHARECVRECMHVLHANTQHTLIFLTGGPYYHVASLL